MSHFSDRDANGSALRSQISKASFRSSLQSSSLFRPIEETPDRLRDLLRELEEVESQNRRS